MPPKWRSFGRKGGAAPPQDVDMTPSKEELNAAHISSSSPPENIDSKNSGQWDMSSLELKRSSPRSPPAAPASTNPFGVEPFENRTSSNTQQFENVNTKQQAPRQAATRASAAGIAAKTPVDRNANAPISSTSQRKAVNIATSAGTNRLNRILHQPSEQKISYVAEEQDRSKKNNNAFAARTNIDHPDNTNEAPQRYSSSRKGSGRKRIGGKPVEQVNDPLNETEVARFVERVVVPPLRVDSRSIGGLVQKSSQKQQHVVQECLVAARCKSFEASGGGAADNAISPTALENPAAYAKHKRSLGLGTKARNKIRYALLVRSTNRPLLHKQRPGNASLPHEESSPEDDEDELTGYDRLYTADQGDVNEAEDNKKKAKEDKSHKEDSVEVSSFPVLVCLVLHSDGTNPDIRKMIELDQLTTIQNVMTTGGSSTVVQLAFRDGDTVRIDFGVPEEQPVVDVGDAINSSSPPAMRKERFVWSLLQIHAMLCTSVVERNSMEATRSASRSAAAAAARGGLLPPLNVRNFDRADLQYVATVNGFLRDSPSLCALLDRQRDIGLQGEDHDDVRDGEEEKDHHDVPLEEMDGMAYDMMMGNYSTRVALFVSAEERADAEEVLNATHQWQNSSFLNSNEDYATACATETIAELLQRRMRDLEAETCRRLIAWEDEKHYSLTGRKGLFSDHEAERDTVDALSLGALFTTLDTLDQELGHMEEWLQERAAGIKPLTDDCRDIEEENRQLEQQWKSCDMLGKELVHLLHGLDIPGSIERCLNNPASALAYDPSGAIDVEASEPGVEKIHDAGKYLKDALVRAKEAGGVHLRAVSERCAGLEILADRFCTELAKIVATVMEQIAAEVVASSDHGKVSKADTHAAIAKKIRDTQRKFQSALLGYIKLIEVLQKLKPKLLPAIRDAYSEMVAEGILMKKRMKGYFQALPGKNTAYMTVVTMDLKDYIPFGESGSERTVNAADMEAALSELLPVIAREAYFTAALFGLSSKNLDGREKKRNFESAKKSVDHSSQYFRYYISRTVGITTADAETEGGVARGDPMLSLVASIYLNDAMDNYIDREKKGGDHSLSLAYVRALILELRKKVDKQWVTWVEEQIEWIKTNPGVPPNGKRAGVFSSFARFPSYLDHILLCVREGKKKDYTPDLANIKVISYYMQKMASALLESLRDCAERETTDQHYAANVMRMENTYFFTQSIKQRGPEMSALFQKQLTRASAICKQSTDAYLGWMIKREFKALHALFSNISRIRRDVGDKDVPIHVPRATFVKTLSKESNREVMKEKIGIIYSRMEKHLSENGGLLPVAWKALVKVLYEWFGRWEKLSSQCYKHVLEPSAVDVVRIAKAIGGGEKQSSRRQNLAAEATPGRPARNAHVISKRNLASARKLN